MEKTNNSFCDVCGIDCNNVKGGALLEGDATKALTFLCLYCYKLSSEYLNIKIKEELPIAKEVVNFISSFPKGKVYLKLFREITSNWDNVCAEYDSLINLYIGYKAGLSNHPLYVKSLTNLLCALIYSVGFPITIDAMFFPLNMNITATANSILFRRRYTSMSFISPEGKDLKIKIAKIRKCEYCFSSNAKLKCRKCKSVYFCSKVCVVKGRNFHKIPCEEIINIDKEVENIKIQN